MEDCKYLQIWAKWEMFYVLRKLKSVPGKVWLLLTLSVTVILVVLVIGLSRRAMALNSGPTATTQCGEVRGRTAEAPDGTQIQEFLYMPYGVPPTGQRRWTHSELLAGEDCWAGTYRADLDRDISCVQGYYLPPKGQEDCLYLSVRTPQMSGSDLPVLVWVHGGSLVYGKAEDPGYSADVEFTASVNAVTVNINYRLDLLGFLSRPELWEDGESYGNFGIGDALTALRWVHANIGNFGGNNRKITLMGESSGGTIVMGLLASPKASGLFERVISMSAAALWNSSYEDAHERRPDFLDQVKCSGLGSVDETRNCLKNAPVELLIESSTTENRGYGFYDFPMSAGRNGESMDYNVREPTLIPDLPGPELSQSQREHAVQVIIANTAQENSFWQIFYGNNDVQTWADAESLLSSRIETLFGHPDVDLLNKIKEKYSFGVNTDNWWPQLFWDTLSTDIRATCPMNVLADTINTNPALDVYRLYISHRPSMELAGGQHWGAWHGWDTEALFGFKYYRGSSYNTTAPHDLELGRQVRDVVREFVHGKTENWDVSKPIFLTNSAPWRGSGKESPQEGFCDFWGENELLGWGWQN